MCRRGEGGGGRERKEREEGRREREEREGGAGGKRGKGGQGGTKTKINDSEVTSELDDKLIGENPGRGPCWWQLKNADNLFESTC